MGIRGEIFSTRIDSERRTFFFNVKENRNNDRFINIVESRKNTNESFDRSQIMIYEEDIDRFIAELQKAVSVLRGTPAPERPYPPRPRFPRTDSSQQNRPAKRRDGSRPGHTNPRREHG